MNRVYIVNKPRGLSSHDIVNKARHLLGRKKVGHTGTLDPFATGVLLILSDEATKIARFLEAKDKTYVATLRLGIKTDTGDCTGTQIETSNNRPTKEEIEEAFKGFIGESKQIPPMYSAIKIQGKKLYELARKGKVVEREPRTIKITSLDLLNYDGEKIVFKVDCSVGTYIRVLGEDIASKLNTVGHLEELQRTRIGRWRIEQAIGYEDIKEDNGIDILEALQDYPLYKVNKEEEMRVRNGKTLSIPNLGEEIVIVNEEEKLLAIYYLKDNNYYCLRGFNL